MTNRTSAGLLLYRSGTEGPSVFIAHMGGPFWSRKDDGAWSIPKGEAEPGEDDLLAVAYREFAEEIGCAAPDGPALDLGEFVQRSGKRVRAFAVRSATVVGFIQSNTFDLEWPRGSGEMRKFPEMDGAAWFALAAARRKLVPGQAPILDALAAALGRDPATDSDRHPGAGRG